MHALLIAGLLSVLAGPHTAQRKMSEEEFVKARPALGTILPDVTVYDPTGKEFKTSSLRGHYSVLTFGCLT